MTTFRVDGTGVHVPSLEEALAETRQEFSEIFGDDLTNAVQTPQGQLAGVFAMAKAVIGEALVDLGTATDPNNAIGTQLDRLYGLLDILRQIATRSRVTATVTGVPGTGLPAGSRAKTTADVEFRTLADVVLAATPGVWWKWRRWRKARLWPPLALSPRLLPSFQVGKPSPTRRPPCPAWHAMMIRSTALPTNPA